jgi:hypothetical protein
MEQLKVNEVVVSKYGRTGYVAKIYSDGSASIVWHGSMPPLNGLGHERVPAHMLRAERQAERYLRETYGAYRGHYEWRAMEAAFNAGMDVASAMPAEQKLTKPVSIGGVRFHVGVDVSHVLRAAERRYEYEQSPECKALQAERVAQFMSDSAKALSDGCGACADACAKRGSCRLDGESPQPAGEVVQAIRLGFDYLDNGQLVATYAVPVASQAAPKLYTAPPAQELDARLVEALEAVVEAGRMSNSSRARYCAEIASAALAAAPQPNGGANE